MKRLLLLIVCLVGSSGPLVGGEAGCCCDHCGCAAQCAKVCRCVPVIKKVPKVTWTCECEEFCVPGPSERHVVCDECGHKKHVFTPTCATMRTRKKAVKHETVEEVVSYKWVVEDVCPACSARCAANEPERLGTAPFGGGDAAPLR